MALSMARVGILLADGFEDVDFRALVDRLHHSGNEVIVLGAERGITLRGRCGLEETVVHAEFFDFSPEQFHGLAIPGGYSPSYLSDDQEAIQFVRLFFLSGRPIVAIGSGPELLIPSGLAAGCLLTATPALKPLMEEAGASWVDAPIVIFGNGHIVTGRGGGDTHHVAHVFDRCIRGSQSMTCPRESPPETPPLDC